jgi:hypothetical protein
MDEVVDIDWASTTVFFGPSCYESGIVAIAFLGALIAVLRRRTPQRGLFLVAMSAALLRNVVYYVIVLLELQVSHSHLIDVILAGIMWALIAAFAWSLAVLHGKNTDYPLSPTTSSTCPNDDPC